jgi:pRiA4b ORF-3-like protein
VGSPGACQHPTLWRPHFTLSTVKTMRQEDWFERFTFVHSLSTNRVDEGARKQALEALSALENVLNGADSTRAFNIPGLSGFHGRAARLEPEERKWAERLGERLWNAKGTGRTYAEEALLGQVALQASPDSLPFFRAAVEFNRARDSFQVQRRRIAVAAVAFTALQTGDAASHAQLEAWLAHPDLPVRTEATAVYGRVHLPEEGRLKPAARAALEHVAYQDRAFAPRFLARGWLHTAGIPVRVEPPDGIYVFRASLGSASRTVELKASATLSALASSILNAFGWDHEHLYEFALSGDIRDRRFVVPRDDEEAEPLRLALGRMGFPKGHTFLFRYDFGDDNRFRVTVVNIQDHASPGEKYPRVVARMGEDPEQYPSAS